MVFRSGFYGKKALGLLGLKNENQFKKKKICSLESQLNSSA